MRQAISASRNSYLRPMGVTPTIRGCIMKLGRSNAASAFPTSLVSFFYETLYLHFSVTRFFPLISNTLVRTCTDRKRRKQWQIPLASGLLWEGPIFGPKSNPLSNLDAFENHRLFKQEGRGGGYFGPATLLFPRSKFDIFRSHGLVYGLFRRLELFTRKIYGSAFRIRTISQPFRVVSSLLMEPTGAITVGNGKKKKEKSSPCAWQNGSKLAFSSIT